MKNNKLKAKKGMTLIEVIISVTLLSILVVPLSGLVMSSLKNNKDSEYRQKASYVGQKVLEELKAYDKITLKDNGGEKYFELLDGDKIVRGSTGNTFTGSFERTIYGSTSEISSNGEEVYNVEVIMEKDKIFNGDTTDSLDEYENVDFRLDFVKDITDKIKLDSSNITLLEPRKTEISINNTDNLMMEINRNSNLGLKIYKKNNNIEYIGGETITTVNNKILLFQEKDYSSEINIEVKNNTSNIIELYLIKENGSTHKINLVSTKGNVILYEEEQPDKSKANSMYNYTVIVKDKDNNILFEGSSSKNLYIE